MGRRQGSIIIMYIACLPNVVCVSSVNWLQVLLYICLSRNLQGLPIFEQPPPKYSAHHIMEILLNPSMNKSLITHGRPLQIEKSSTFVVDFTSLKQPDDVKKDMYGRWDYSNSP